MKSGQKLFQGILFLLFLGGWGIVQVLMITNASIFPTEDLNQLQTLYPTLSSSGSESSDEVLELTPRKLSPLNKDLQAVNSLTPQSNLESVKE